MNALDIEQEQQEKLTEIGGQLSKIRLQKKISVEEIATKTMVQPRFIHAIENGRLEDLPESLYVRGFIRRYAEALGMDGIQISETFPLSHGKTISSSSKFLGNGSTALRPWHLYLLYMGLIVGAGLALTAIMNRQSSQLSGGSTTPPLSAPNPTTAAKSPPKPTQVAVKPRKPTAPVQAVLTIKDDAYVEILADGTNIDTVTLKKGTSKTYTAQKSLVIFSGNPGGILLGANGQSAKLMGEAGIPKEVTLTPGKQTP
jgi:cytoskeletal protein RodZ